MSFGWHRRCSAKSKDCASGLEQSEHIVMGRLPLFSEPITEPSTSIIGLQVTLPQPCRCGKFIAITGSSGGPHYVSIFCSGCGTHRAWMLGATYNFLSTIIDQFGRPVQPIEVTLNSRTPLDNPATATER
jgi:hypothetical protein